MRKVKGMATDSATNTDAPASRLLLLSLLFLAALPCVGCVSAPTLYPLQDKSIAATDDNIVGRWEEVDDNAKGKDKKNKTRPKNNCCWTIKKDGDAYTSEIPDTDDKEIWITKIHLVKIGDAMFFDAAGDDLKYSHTTELASPVLKAHAIGRIWIEKDSLRVALLSDDWLKDKAKSGSPPLSFIEPDSQLVVTATTEQLRAFAKQYANDTKAFSDEFTLRRHK